MKKILTNLAYLAVIVLIGVSIAYGGATFSRVKTWSASETLTASDLNAEFDNILNNLAPSTTIGYSRRPPFTWKDADEIYIGAGVYEINGKLAYWDSKLTSDIGSPDVTDWYYLYLDYSAITSGTAITTSELVWSNTEPAWSETYHGLYNGDDRCIFAVLTDGSSNIKEFFHEGDHVFFADLIISLGATATSTTWTDATLSAPKFTTLVSVCFQTQFVDNSQNFRWRTNGQTGAIGHNMGYAATNARGQYNSCVVLTDSNQKIEVKAVNAGTGTISVNTDGWVFPVGM